MANFRFGLNNVNAGPIAEFPEICVDRFIDNDLKSTAFFLTHGHTDHLVGLETKEFLRRLDDSGIKLYCQPLTPILVGSFGRYLGGTENIKDLIKRGKIVLLENTTTDIEIPSEHDYYTVSVTLLPAGHCPGSVMFLFEKDPVRVLHTGDCRITVDDIKKMTALHEVDSKNVSIRKKIDRLYIDTTFCCPEADTFPNRMDVISKLLELVGQWINQSKRHRVMIKFPARFSHEYVLIRLHSWFKMQIHVNKDKFEIYKEFPRLSESTTLNPNTQLHFCDDKRCGLSDEYTFTIKMSSMWYIRTKGHGLSTLVRKGSKHVKVCYAMHPSLTEVAEIIDYLQPQIVTPLVKPKDININDVEAALRRVCNYDFAYEAFNDISCHGKINKRSHKTDCAEYSKKLKEEMDTSKLNANDEEPCDKKIREGRIESVWDFKLSQSPQKNCSQSSDSLDEQREN